MTTEIEPLAHERFHRAIRDRDGRFDGLFFTAVVTTGVYCRPGCPGRPKRENMRILPSSAAAEGAGFRPCLRCHPERSPGAPSWGRFPERVSRALALIEDDALFGGGVAGLGTRLGVDAAGLERAFAEHVGATPEAVARTRRLHFARCLVAETSLPPADIATACGFSTVRSLGDAIRSTFERRLGDLPRRPLAAPEGWVATSLPYRPPLDWARMVGYLRVRAIPGVEMADDESYRRTVQIGGRASEIEIAFVEKEPRLILRVPAAMSPWLMEITTHARRVFDLDADPMRIAADLGRSEALAEIASARPGLRVPRAWDPFELAVRAILGQQISVRAATTLAGRLVEAHGLAFEGSPGGLTHVFPRPQALASADLRAIGATGSQERAIRALARAVAGGELVLDAARGLDDFVSRACELPGIGPWTAQYVAMRGLGEPDAFPAGDLGLRRALVSEGETMAERELAACAEEWRPWRAYAAMHLWMAGSGGAGAEASNGRGG